MTQAPRIHLNGTSREALLEGYEKAHDAVLEAILQLRVTAPNGRDYYIISSTAIDDAMREHRARMQKLEDVAEELRIIMEVISK